MELSRNRMKKAGTVASVGAGGAMLLGCAACCAPLVAPLLAWLGVAGLAFLGPIGMVAAAIGAVALIGIAVKWRRRRSQLRILSNSNACRIDCGAKCN